MPRSIKVRQACIPEVKASLLRQGFVRQSDLAEQAQLSQSTVSKFLNGTPVYYLNFIEICEFLGLEWQTIADLNHRANSPPAPSPLPLVEIPPQADCPPDTLIEPSEGPIALDSALYVERSPIEQRCYAEIVRPGCLIWIKAPRQMGKTSLMVRILQLRIPERLGDYWNSELLGSKVSCKTYFEQYLLPKLAQPLTLGIDEVDCLFKHPTLYQDFFGLLRVLHEESKREEIWQQLRLVVVHPTEVYLPIDMSQSLFNVGLSIELPEFSLEQVQDLVQRYQFDWTLDQVRQFMAIIGGHPFLIRLALTLLVKIKR